MLDFLENDKLYNTAMIITIPLIRQIIAAVEYPFPFKIRKLTINPTAIKNVNDLTIQRTNR